MLDSKPLSTQNNFTSFENHPAFGSFEFDFSAGDSFPSLVDQSLQNLKPDSLIKGHITRITPDFVIMDVGYKSQGYVPYAEFLNPEGKFAFTVGDEVEVYLENLENQEGQVVLSREKGQRVRVWEEVKNIYEQDRTIEGVIVAKIKGGLQVEIGLKAFLPGSQIDLRPIKNLDSLLGEKMEFKILKFNQKRGNVVLSRRALLEVNREDRRKKTIDALVVNTKVKGHVKNITDYGVFVDLGGIDGLLHITDITWGRISHPSEVYQIGDEIEVLILSYDAVSEKVSLGVKQLESDPWTTLAQKYQVGDKVKGKIVNTTIYGVFVELEQAIEGLIHVSEMSWTKKVRSPTSMVQIGEEVEAIIKEIDLEKRRISLSLRDVQANPWHEIAERLPVGSIVEGEVRNITDYGIFIGLEPGIDGLVHASDVFWSQRQKKNISEMFTKGQKIHVKLLNIDPERGRLSLGIKQLSEDPWKDLDKELQVGDDVRGKIVHVADFGVFVELKSGVEGLIHFSEIGKDMTKKQLLEQFPLESDVSVRVMKIDVNEKRLALAPLFSKKEKEIESGKGEESEVEKDKNSPQTEEK